MLEWLMLGAVIVSIARIADFEDLPVWPWTLAIIGACFLAMMVPLPYLRLFIAWVIVLIAMTIWNATVARRV